MNEPAIGEVRPEYVTPGWAERVARSIAPVRDVSGRPVRPGRALLNAGDGTLVTVTVPAG